CEERGQRGPLVLQDEAERVRAKRVEARVAGRGLQGLGIGIEGPHARAALLYGGGDRVAARVVEVEGVQEDRALGEPETAAPVEAGGARRQLGIEPPPPPAGPAPGPAPPPAPHRPLPPRRR